MKKVRFVVLTCIMYFFVYSIQLVLVHRFVNPVVTPLMLLRIAEGLTGSENSLQIKKQWKTLDEISVNVGYAVIASEDFNFFQHDGFDWRGIKRAIRYNQKHEHSKMRGASTISQQTAKNIFLVPSRTWFRKGIEMYFTILIEALWSKERILEVYLNVIELGNGIYGIESGAEWYFNKTASELTKTEAASLTAILPDPLHRSPLRPDRYGKRKVDEILILMNIMESRSLEFRLEGFKQKKLCY